MAVQFDRCACRGDLDARFGGFATGQRRSCGGEAALSVEARYLEPDLPDELQQAYAQTFDRLRRMFRARGCTPEEAADLAQDAAVRAFVHIRRWGVNGTGLDPLLNRIARNLLIDRYRRTTPHIVPLDDAGELQDPDQDPTEEVARRQRTHAVRSAIQGLPVRHQTAITHSLNGLTPEEVGRRMGIGRNAADALLHRARRSLKERLQTVGEGMFGVALGIRVRWDKMTRRNGVGGGADVLQQAAQTGVAAAAAVIIAVIGIAGAGAGSSAEGRDAPGALVSGTSVDRTSSVTASPEALGSDTDVGSIGAEGSGGGSQVNGPFMQNSVGPGGVYNDVTVPSGNPDRPLIDVNHQLSKYDEGDQPENHLGGLVGNALCRGAARLCAVVNDA